MASVNKVILVGNLGRDPEVRYTANGAAICNLTIATSRNWKDKNSGEKMEETEWHRVVLYDKLAEIAGQYLKKGRSVYIEGRLKTRKWTDKDGVEKYTTEIIVTEMQMLGGGRDGDRSSDDFGGSSSFGGGYEGGNSGGGNSGGGYSRPQQAPARQQAPAPVSSSSGSSFDDMDDDIPF